MFLTYFFWTRKCVRLFFHIFRLFCMLLFRWKIMAFILYLEFYLLIWLGKKLINFVLPKNINYKKALWKIKMTLALEKLSFFFQSRNHFPFTGDSCHRLPTWVSRNFKIVKIKQVKFIADLLDYPFAIQLGTIYFFQYFYFPKTTDSTWPWVTFFPLKVIFPFHQDTSLRAITLQ